LYRTETLHESFWPPCGRMSKLDGYAVDGSLLQLAYGASWGSKVTLG